jgi:hypothetical protein
VVAYVRPHDVDIAHEAHRAALDVAVDRRTDLGWTAKLHLRLADGQTILAQVRNDQAQSLHAGMHLYASLRGAKIFPNGGPAPTDLTTSAPETSDPQVPVPSSQSSAPPGPLLG